MPTAIILALFIVEPGAAGISVEPEPAMGIRAAGTGRLIFEDVKLPAGALLGEADADAFRECVQLGRLGWCALALGTGQRQPGRDAARLEDDDQVWSVRSLGQHRRGARHSRTDRHRLAVFQQPGGAADHQFHGVVVHGVSV